MGYTTDFEGSVTISPPLNAEEIRFLTKFAGTRRMGRQQGPYYVDAPGDFGQGHDPKIINYNEPPRGQPSLWCHWVPSEDGTSIAWDGGEKFYNSVDWMEYIINHFLRPGAIAARELPFLQANHTVSGVISAQGEEPSDMWRLVVEDNVVRKQVAQITYA